MPPPIEMSAPSRTPQVRILTIGADRVELLPAAPYDVAYTPQTPVIGFAFETQTGAHAFASDRMSPFRTRPNSLAYVPAGCEVASRSRAGGEYLAIRHLSGADPPRRFNDHIDPAAVAAAYALRRLILMGQAADPLEIERELARLHEVVSGILTRPGSGARAAGWITPRRLRLVEDLVEARLDGSLPVHEMAASLGLSPGFFNRAFKAAVGKTPHDYVIDRRVARARKLLDTSAGLAEIAAACGFASHAHMTTQLRRRLGVPPRALRAGSDQNM
ncbi:MAG TPA: AraC family transcriptional regulator [Aliidongia sp.]|uniref:AraC family transcriptional regulator n=1 Tax=Aliidongia sp. TaxID=1914230 RepID=UPI002DDD6543|nr:AraC family transcriptional regulator [Aliidongia sp.]HEV2674701.1 AraC family transcriptional regulator [Aliidongia sp.]